MKDIMAILGIDGTVGTVVYFIDPTYLKWVLAIGLASLVGLFYFTKQGRVSIYGTQLTMAIMLLMRFAK